uniref:Uncharacterized protein n=1 Tax=Pyxicephalus adspersus TaxID=30357 RepID=A0AAV3AN23_PYXAD|nr:TPA: hypothetical protein GDO54_008872 [Pyxicephalus adspersus]
MTIYTVGSDENICTFSFESEKIPSLCWVVKTPSEVIWCPCFFIFLVSSNIVVKAFCCLSMTAQCITISFITMVTKYLINVNVTVNALCV